MILYDMIIEVRLLGGAASLAENARAARPDGTLLCG